MKPYLTLAIISAAVVAGCTPQQRSMFDTYSTVIDPSVSISDKACAVLDWGVPIAQRRVTLTGTQAVIADGAAAAARAYCEGKDLRWQDRAIAAADTLSKVLWDVIK